jgi:hypothetical protein
VSGALPLERLQRWMQSVVTHPGDIEEAAGSAEARRELPPEQVGAVILPSATLTPLERLEIYQGMYPLRMEEALASDFPGLKHFLGDHAFFHLVTAYTEAHPSRSFTLNPLGEHLAAFVATAPVPRPAFCAELARLERTIAEMFDAPETPALGEEAITQVPAEAWETARLVPIAALRLLALRYPAGAYLDSLKDERHQHPSPARADEYVVVYRRDYAVYRQDLSRAAHHLLADLAAGQTVGAAVAAALRRRGRARPQEDDLFRWFRQWAGAGLFTRVELG